MADVINIEARRLIDRTAEWLTSYAVFDQTKSKSDLQRLVIATNKLSDVGGIVRLVELSIEEDS